MMESLIVIRCSVKMMRWIQSVAPVILPARRLDGRDGGEHFHVMAQGSDRKTSEFGFNPIKNDKLRSKVVHVIPTLAAITLLAGCSRNMPSAPTAADVGWVNCQGLPKPNVYVSGVPGHGESNITGFAESGQNLVAGTYVISGSEDNVYLSTDNGITWSLDAQFPVFNTAPLEAGLSGPSPLSFLSYSGILLAGISGPSLRPYKEGGLYISTDNGVTWSDSNITWPAGDSIQDVNCFAAIKNEIFAGTDYHGVVSSTDNGRTWTEIDSALSKIGPITRLTTDGYTMYLGTNSSRFYESTDYGKNWTSINSGLTNISETDLTTTGGRAYASIWSSGIFVFNNNNSRWAAVNSGLSNLDVNAIASGGGDLFAGTNSGLFVSLDDGSTWAYDSIGSPPQALAVDFVAVENSYLYVSTSEGVWRFPIAILPESLKNQGGAR